LSEVFYILTTTTLKISLGLFFLRVLTKKWQRHIFHVILSVSAAYGLFYVLTSIFACGNPAKIADALLGSEKCLPTSFILSTGYLYGSLNVIADWTFVLLPISVLIDSELDRRSKISISIVMALGAVGSVSSIMRMVYLRGLILSPTSLSSTFTTSPDSHNSSTNKLPQVSPSKQQSGLPQSPAPASSPPLSLSCAHFFATSKPL
jgi:hypothetical protein